MKLTIRKGRELLCPVCGHFSVAHDVVVDKEGTKGDQCVWCNTVFPLSGLVFVDSKLMCECGHSRFRHNGDIGSCVDCNCEYYIPIEIKVYEN